MKYLLFVFIATVCASSVIDGEIERGIIQTGRPIQFFDAPPRRAYKVIATVVVVNTWPLPNSAKEHVVEIADRVKADAVLMSQGNQSGTMTATLIQWR